MSHAWCDEQVVNCGCECAANRTFEVVTIPSKSAANIYTLRLDSSLLGAIGNALYESTGRSLHRSTGDWSNRRQTKTAKVKTAIRDPVIYFYLWSPYVIGQTMYIFILFLLWSPYVIGQTIYIFILFLSSFFFPRLISAVGDSMFTLLWHMVWP